MAKLYSLLKADEKQARRLAIKDLKANGYEPVVEKDFIYAAGTVPVLLIAHYDTVPKPPKYIQNKGGILSAKKGLGADDRAGMYAILELIQKHHVHVLFTGGEEIGGIGAEAFTCSGIKPEVNYIIQLDRRGENDAVYYELDNPEFEEFITSHGWQTTIGTFTDICIVAPYLGVAAVNLSIGYQNEHHPNETLDLNVMNKNIARVPELLDGEKYEWKEVKYSYRSLYGYGYGYGYDWDSWESYGYYGRKDRYDDQQYLIEFVKGDDKDGLTDCELVEAMSYTEAIGCFLMSHPDLTYNHVLDCYSEDDLEEIGVCPQEAAQ